MKNARTPDGNALKSFPSNWIGVRWMDGRENPFGRPQSQPRFFLKNSPQCFRNKVTLILQLLMSFSKDEGKRLHLKVNAHLQIPVDLQVELFFWFFQ